MNFWTSSFWTPGFWTDHFWTGVGGGSVDSSALQPGFVMTVIQYPGVSVDLPQEAPPP